MKRPLQSIRWRIQAWHGLILLVAIAAFCVTAHQLVWQNQVRRIDRELSEMDRTLIRSLLQQEESAAENAPPSKTPIPEALFKKLKQGAVHPSPAITNAFSQETPGYFYYALADSQEEILLQSSNTPAALNFLPLPEQDMSDQFRMNGKFRESAHSSAFGLRSIVGRDITPELEEMRRFAWSLGISGVALWLFGLLGGWWLAGKAIQPIQSISKTATRIADGNLNERISTAGNDSELDQLSHVLNHTFDRLNTALEQQRQFTADASHELRTPLTILLSESQRMRKRNMSRSEIDYQEAFDLCYDAGMRMRDLVESLLLLARQDSNSPSLCLVDCDLATIVQDCATQLRPLADSKHISLELDIQPCPFESDPKLLVVVFNNLIGNAIEHHQGNGTVRIKCIPLSNSIKLTVTDDGPGISEEDLPRIFDRFYRADKARGSQNGHSGLGLALVKAITQTLGAQIEVTSCTDAGSTFTAIFNAPPKA